MHDLPPFEFAKGSFTKTLSENSKFQLHFQHKEASSMPLGVVTFTASDESLNYEAKFSKTRAADEVLELINDEALTDVSIGFIPLKGTKKPMRFTENKILELSVVDKGALYDAKIAEAFQYDIDAYLKVLNHRRLRLLGLQSR